MPYKDKEKQREYQRNWMRKRREDFFKDKECVACGATDNLELDHIHPNTKDTHRIWSWSKFKREGELKHCQVLCEKCHQKKTGKFNRENIRTITDEDVIYIRNSSERQIDLAKRFGICQQHISKIKRGERFKNLPM